ncbi:MAG TPA: hypothetical protein VGK35_14320 [Actinotalea sp.]|jgi:hypothetical protein
MTTSEARRPTVDSLGILLPASWWTIDLRDDAARTRSVAALVEQQIGRADVQATLRADIRRELGQAAEQAAAAGGRLMAVSLMQADGLPLSATLTAYRVPGADLTGTGLTELEGVLRDSAQGTDVAIDLAEGARGPVLRRVTRRSGAADLGAERLSMLVADYWLDPDDGHGLLLLTFSSPLVEARDAWLGLFDTIVASVAPAEGPRERQDA